MRSLWDPWLPFVVRRGLFGGSRHRAVSHRPWRAIPAIMINAPRHPNWKMRYYKNIKIYVRAIAKLSHTQFVKLSVISPHFHRDGLGSWNLSSWNTKTYRYSWYCPSFTRTILPLRQKIRDLNNTEMNRCHCGNYEASRALNNIMTVFPGMIFPS